MARCGLHGSVGMQEELLIKAQDRRWVPIVDGIELKLLRASAETGDWTVLFRCQPGSFFPSHRHYGAGEYYMLTGRMVYRMGEAVAGDYGYEPLGATHEKTTFPEYSELIFTNHGPVIFLNADGSLGDVLDHETITQLCAGQEETT